MHDVVLSAVMTEAMMLPIIWRMVFHVSLLFFMAQCVLRGQGVRVPGVVTVALGLGVQGVDADELSFFQELSA